MTDSIQRPHGRAVDAARPVSIEVDPLKYAEGSALIDVGDTRVLVAATFEKRVPPFLIDSGKGWVTGEYAMLPRATSTRSPTAPPRPVASCQELGVGKALRPIAMSMAADVTELRDSLHQLAEAEASYRRIVEQSLVGIFLMDGEVLLYANKRVANILGYEPEEIAGSPIERFVCDADLPDVAGAAARLLAGDAVIETLEFRARRKDSSEILIGTQATLSKRSGAAVIMGVMQDITGHASRVGMIAAAIGTELGLDEEMIEGLQVAGQLHDIGKIQTPAELLSSPRKLLPFELELIKFHAQAGHDVLEKVDFPWPLADVAHQHHERMDGSGYPQGLKGDAICLEARIIAVADVVEAMASHRPYRPGLGIDKALDEIERGRDRFYDADVCDACLRLFREKGFVLPAR